MKTNRFSLTFFRADYQQLVFAGMGGREYDGKTKLLPPTILKPVALWSGKQILSSVIINLTPKDRQLINMNSTAKISIKDWQTVPPRKWNGGGPELQGNNMTENEVIIQHGELLVGVLDKMHYGSTSYSLVHLFNELYGGQYSCRLLSCFSRLFTAYLQLKGFSLGVEDILVTPQADKKRKKILKRLEKVNYLKNLSFLRSLIVFFFLIYRLEILLLPKLLVLPLSRWRNVEWRL